ncbi:MAG: MFS transporter [Armatimonadetes bacterium]|nr:MFS transporter [Armatimonadota bacterium]
MINDRRELSTKACDESTRANAAYPKLTAADIRHNMIFIVMLDAIFTMGVSDLQLVTGPVWKYLKASNTLIGLVGSLSITALFGVFISPFISVRCRYKKWYLFVSHLPYIGAWGALGVVLLLSRQWGLSDEWLLWFTVVMLGANTFFGGFVGLPHQEYIVACIPMSHRGRYTGYSYSIGSALSIATMALGGWILLRVAKPGAYGYLFLLVWLFCQAGYVMALFGREKPVPIEKAPKPWSKAMLAAAWNDKRFLKLLLINGILMAIFWPLIFTFLPQYALRDLGLMDAAAAVIGTVMLVVRIVASSPIGHLTDKFSPKRVLPLWPLVVGVGMLVAVLVRNQYGVYIATAMGAAMTVGVCASLNPLIYGIPSAENRSGHFTLQLLSMYVANSIGPIVIGGACDWLGYRMVFLASAFLGVALCFVCNWLLRDLSANSEDYA